MNVKKWVSDQVAAEEKKALPVLSFPAIQLMDVTVAELIGSSDLQARAMELVAGRVDSAASVSFMDLSVEAEVFGAKIKITNDEVPTVIGAMINEDTDPDSIVVPEVGAGRTGLYIEAIAQSAPLITDRPVFAGIIGPFSLTGRLMDVSEVMVLCYEEPDLVHAVLDKCTTFLTEYALAYRDVAADGVVMAEPLAGLLSPDLAEEFSAPYVKRIVDAVQTDEFGVVYHNCGGGAVRQIDSILSVGAIGYHFGNAIDMADVMPHIPANVLAMGNIDPAGQIRNGTPESIKEETLKLLESCARYPNFIPSTGCDIPPLSPWENIDAFFNAVKEFYCK